MLSLFMVPISICIHYKLTFPMLLFRDMVKRA